MSAAPNKDTIYIDLEDEITTIIDKVEAGAGSIVALVLPKRTAVLQSVVNMRLLKRAAESAGKRVVLITSEAGLLPLAGAVGLHVAKTLSSKPEIPSSPKAAEVAKEEAKEAAEEATDAEDSKDEDADEDLDGSRPIGELASTDDDTETIALDDPGDDDKSSKKSDKKADKPKKDKKLSVPNFDRFRLLLIGGIGLLVLLIVFIVLAIKVLPKATITIQTDSTPVTANFIASTSGAAKTVDTSTLVLPSVLKTNKQVPTETSPATGQQDLGNKATGTVVLANCDDSDSVTVPSGTTISSSGGQSYITQTALLLGAGNFDSHGNCKKSGQPNDDSTAVVAAASGTQYNIAATNFTVTGFSSVTGSSSAAMSGGTSNVVTVVSQADVDAAKKKFDATAISTSNKNFTTQLSSSGAYIIPASETTSDPAYTVSPGVGQQGSNVTVTETVNYTVLTIQKSDLQKLITAQLSKQINTSIQEITPGDATNGATINVQNTTNPTDLSLEISKSTTAIPIIDTAQVAKQAIGQKDGDIQNSLSNRPGVKNVNVKMSPFWVSKAPSGKGKVHVILQQVTGN